RLFEKDPLMKQFSQKAKQFKEILLDAPAGYRLSKRCLGIFFAFGSTTGRQSDAKLISEEEIDVYRNH
ncbi:MAG: hypothetical protein R6U84_01525, partial [Candidatus Cloacimonadales bacterium]